VFDSPTFFLSHRDTGYTLGLLALAVLIIAAIARAGRAQIGRAALIFGLFVLQSVLVELRESAPAIAALHPLNGFLILLLSMLVARDAWRAVRRPPTVPTEAETPPAA
jgi:cytochrome b561